MRCLTYSESVTWCQKHNYPVKKTDKYGKPTPHLNDLFSLIQLDYPIDSGRKIALARQVIDLDNRKHQLLIWIKEWGVWPSSEHMPLFSRFRQSFGEMRPLIEAPSHLIEVGEIDEAISLLSIALLFFWDCYVFPAHEGPVFFCSHDEWVGFFVPRGYAPTTIYNTFSDWLPTKKNLPSTTHYGQKK
jgi:hypothetical protein